MFGIGFLRFWHCVDTTLSLFDTFLQFSGKHQRNPTTKNRIQRQIHQNSRKTIRKSLKTPMCPFKIILFYLRAIKFFIILIYCTMFLKTSLPHWATKTNKKHRKPTKTNKNQQQIEKNK